VFSVRSVSPWPVPQFGFGVGIWDLGFGICYRADRFINQFGVSSTGADAIVSNPNFS
jgi:hypothetical protein